MLAEDGDTIVLGGLIDEDVQEVEQRDKGLILIPVENFPVSPQIDGND